MAELAPRSRGDDGSPGTFSHSPRRRRRAFRESAIFRASASKAANAGAIGAKIIGERHDEASMGIGAADRQAHYAGRASARIMVIVTERSINKAWAARGDRWKAALSAFRRELRDQPRLPRRFALFPGEWNEFAFASSYFLRNALCSSVFTCVFFTLGSVIMRDSVRKKWGCWLVFVS